jgi:hypothetical protein
MNTGILKRNHPRNGMLKTMKSKILTPKYIPIMTAR